MEDEFYTKKIVALRQLAHDVQQGGWETAMAKRLAPVGFLPQFTLLEDANNKDPLEWQTLLNHPDLDLLPSNFESALYNQIASAWFNKADAASLEKAINFWQQAIAVSNEDEYVHLYYTNLALALRQSSFPTLDVADANRKAWKYTPPENKLAYTIGDRLEAALRVLYEETQDPSLLPEMMGVAYRLLDIESAKSLPILVSLSGWMYKKFLSNRSFPLIDGAIELLQAALLQAHTDEQRSMVFRNLGSAYGTRYSGNQHVNDLEKGIDYIKQAIRYETVENDNWLECNIDLSSMLVSYYEYYREDSYLQHAIAIKQDLLTRIGKNSPYYAIVLNGLALALDLRALPEDGEIVLQLLEEAGQSTHIDNADRMGYRANLADVYRGRFEETGEVTCLDQAENIIRTLMREVENGAYDEVSYFDHLAAILHLRYDLTRNITVLDEGIGLLRKELRSDEAQGYTALTPVSRLCGMLYAKYQYDGQKKHLIECQVIAEKALAAVEKTARARSNVLNKLAITYHHLFLLDGNFADLDHAVELIQEAIDLTRSGSFQLPVYLNCLALILKCRFDSVSLSRKYGRQNRVDLNRAIDAARRSVETPTQPIPSFYGTVTMLLCDRVKMARLVKAATKDIPLHSDEAGQDDYAVNNIETSEDLDQALKYARLGASKVRPDSLEEFMTAYNIGISLKSVVPKDDIKLLEEVTKYSERATELNIKYGYGAYIYDSKEEKIRSVVRAAGLLLEEQKWDEAIDILEPAIDEAQEVISIQALPIDRNIWLSKASELWKMAAFAHAQKGTIEKGAELLEAGLGRVLRENLPLNESELNVLAEFDPALFNEFNAAQHEYTTLSSSITNMRLAAVREKEIKDKLSHGYKELQRILKRIRKVPELQRFQEAPTAADIRSAISGGPLVYMMCVRQFYFAIILPPNVGEPAQFIELPQLVNHKTVSEFIEFHTLFTKYEINKDQKTLLDKLDEWCLNLWPLMAPVLNACQRYNSITIVAGGLMAYYPLHAAYTIDEAGTRRYALDIMRISYTASATALKYARQLAAQASTEKLLAAAVVDDNAFTSFGIEIRKITGCFEAQPKVLLGKVEKEELLRALTACDVFHFTGHGEARFDAMQSGLILSDNEMLTIKEIFHHRFKAIRLAFLSACETAVVDLDAPEESIGLPTVLLQCGIAAVCSTLWPVPEESSMLIVLGFYSYWKDDNRSPVEALRLAAQSVRNITNKELAEFFRNEMEQASPASQLSYSFASEKYHQYLTAGSPLECPFSHPFYWAAFMLSGAGGEDGNSTSVTSILSRANKDENIQNPIPEGLLASVRMPAYLEKNDLFEITVTEEEIQLLETHADHDQLLQLLLTMPVGRIDQDEVTAETRMLIRVVRALASTEKMSFLAYLATDTAANEVLRVICAQAYAAVTGIEDGLMVLGRLCRDDVVSGNIRLLAAQAIWSLGEPEQAKKHIVQIGTVATGEIKLQAAAMICALYDNGALVLPYLLNRRALSPVLGIVDAEDIMVKQVVAAFQKGDLATALWMTGECILKNRAEPTYYFNRAMIYYHLRRYRDAIKDFTEAISRDNNYEKAYSQRGVAYASLLDHEQAIKDFNRAIELNSKDAFNFQQRGRSMEATGRYGQARADFEQARSLSSPDNPEPKFSRRKTVFKQNICLSDDKADEALRQIGAYDELSTLLFNENITYPDRLYWKEALDILACIKNVDYLNKILVNDTLPGIARIEAAYRLEETGINTGRFLMEISLEKKLSLDDREVAVCSFARLRGIDELVYFIGTMGRLLVEFNETPEEESLVITLLRQLYYDERFEYIGLLAHNEQLPLLVQEIAAEMIYASGQYEDAGMLLKRIAGLEHGVPRVRWMAINALKEFGYVEDIRTILQQINSSHTPESELKRRVRDLLFNLKSSGIIVGRYKEEIQKALDAFEAVTSREDMTNAVAVHPVMIQQDFILHIKNLADAPERPGITEKKLQWYYKVPQINTMLTRIKFLECKTKEELEEASKQHPLMLSQGFYDTMLLLLDDENDSIDPQALQLRLSWLQQLPKPIGQQAFDAVLTCNSLQEVRQLIKTYPWIRTKYFLDQFENLVTISSGHVKQTLMEKIVWIRQLSNVRTGPEVARAFSLHYDEGRSAEAIELMDNIIAEEPEFADVLLARGLFYAELGQRDKALPDLLLSAELDPTSPMVHRLLAKCFFDLGRDEEAIVNAGKAIALDASMGEAYQVRGSSRYRQKEWAMAVADFTMAIENGVQDWLPYYMRAFSRFNLQQDDEALADIDIVLEKEPDMVQAILLKTEFLWFAGRKQEARDSLYFIHAKGHATEEDFGRLYDMVVLDEIPAVDDGISAFVHARSIEELEQVCAVFPFVMETHFIAYVTFHLNPRVIKSGRPSLIEKIGWLENIRVNHSNVILWCFNFASTREEVQQLANRFPSAVNPDAINQLEVLYRNAPADVQQVFRQKIEWLRAAEVPEAYKAFFAFQQCASKEDLEKAVNAHPILCDAGYRANLRVSIDRMPDDLIPTFNVLYEMLQTIPVKH